MSETTPETESAPETGEPEPQGGDEDAANEEEVPSPEPPADAPPPVDMEKAFKALDREHSRHEKRVAEIMGPDFETMRLCVMCDGIGFMTPDASVVEAYRFNPEAKALALVSTDARPDELYRDNPQTQRCETCDGRGQVKTGARPEAAAIGTCPTCGGQGWTLRSNMTQLSGLPLVVNTSGVGVPAGAPVVAPNVPVDPELAAAAERLRAAGWTAFEPYREVSASA